MSGDGLARLASKIGATCGGDGFTATTKVLLASGAAIPISQLKVGRSSLPTLTPENPAPRP